MTDDDRQPAPPRRYVDPKTPVLVGVVDADGKPVVIRTTYKEAQATHLELGQTLARMMRKRGSAHDPVDDDPTGGTPVAVRRAA